MDSIAIYHALKHLCPDASWSLDGDDYDDIVWHDESDVPSRSDVENAWEKVRHDVERIPLRDKRNKKLSECDWTVLADAPLTDAKQKEWKKYRQALRDLPNAIDNPMGDIEWPEPPA